MMFKKTFVLFISFVSVAEAQVTSSYQQQAVQSGAVNSSGQLSSSATNAVNRSGTTRSGTQQLNNMGSGNTGINNGAKGANIAQLIGTGTNLAVAGYMASMCGPQNPMACAMAAMAAAQAASMLGGAGGAQQTANASGGMGSGGIDWGASGTGSGPGSGSGINPLTGAADSSNGSALAQQQQNELNGIRNMLASRGYAYDANSNSIRTPDGKTIPASAISSPQAMAASGMFGAGDIAAAEELMKGASVAAADRARVIAAEMEEGGGGGGASAAGGGRGGTRSGSESSGLDWNRLFNQNQQNAQVNRVNPAIVNAEGERMIGAGGNMFEAVRLRYDAEEQACRVGMEACSPGARLPAATAGRPGN